MKRRFENMKIGRKADLCICDYYIPVYYYCDYFHRQYRKHVKRTKQMYNESFANVQSSLAMIAGLQSVGKEYYTGAHNGWRGG